MTIGGRLKRVRKSLDMTQEQLAGRLGIGKAALSMIETGKAGLSTRNRNIVVQELNINPDWLDTGEGRMFTVEPDLSAGQRNRALPLQHIPLFSDLASTQAVDYIQIPNLPRCDGAIHVVGESMSPLLRSGDIVLYKRLKDFDDLFWGDMYLLSLDMDGEEVVTVKYVQKSDRRGYVRLVSQNPLHADKELPIERIRSIATVKASIRMNAMK